MTSFFLRARHWQIFLLCIPPIATVVVGNRFKLLAALSELCYLAWLWTAGPFLTAAAKPALRLRLGLFRCDFFCLILYFLIAISVLDKKLSLPDTLLSTLAVAFIAMHFLIMFCVFHILYFVSKSLLIVETGRPVSFYDYAGAFFLIGFFPVGVWTIQPRINHLYANKRERVQISPVLESTQ
jgi:hypothetical protein